MWVRHRTKWAWGSDNDWDWEWFPMSDRSKMESELKEWVIEWAEPHQCTDHFRGVEAEIMDSAPTEVLEKEIRNSEKIVASRTAYLDELRRQLSSVPT